jgi:hypothetical protein
MALDVEHVHFAATELTIEIGGWVGQLSVLLGATPSLCPVQARRDWLHASNIQSGPVFRKIDRWGNIEHRRPPLRAQSNDASPVARSNRLNGACASSTLNAYVRILPALRP